MNTLKLTFAAAVILPTLYVVYLVSDLIPLWSRRVMFLAGLGVRVCGGLLVFVVFVACLYLLMRQMHEHNRQRDGAFALREYWLDPLPRRVLNWLLGRPSARAVYDPNTNLGHAAIIHNAVYTPDPAAGWDRQLAYARDIERTRRAQAVTPGDNVRALPWFAAGRETRGGLERLLTDQRGGQPKPPTIEAPPLPPQLPAPILSTAAAIAESRPAQIVLGQADSGELVRWDLAQTPHLRFHGATQGAGKTNAIQTAAVGALRTGAHVMVCDRVGFKDWREFRRCAELVDTADPAALADALARLLTIYHARTAQLADSDAHNIGAYRGQMQRIVVVISEFGAQMDTARGRGMSAEIEQPLIELTRLAAATGIHIVAEDQVVRRWPAELKANLIPVIGSMPLYSAQACGWQGRGRITPETFARGTFWFAGRTFSAPHTQPELRALLADVPAPRNLVMLTPPCASRSSVPAGGRAGESPEVERWNGTRNVPQERATGTPVEDAPGRWDDVVAAWFAANPQALTGPANGVSDLARAMCRDNEGGNDVNYEAYKGRAHKLFHETRKSIRLPNGDKLGTDITGGA